MGLPNCPICNSSQRVVSLPQFVGMGGNLVGLNWWNSDPSEMEFRELASDLAMPPLPSISLGVMLRMGFLWTRIPNGEVLNYLERASQWWEVYKRWRNSYVCVARHPLVGQEPLGPRVFYQLPEGKWMHGGPYWFINAIKLML